MQPARTVPSGHVQAVASVSVTPPIGLAADTLDALRHLESSAGATNASEVESMAESATVALVQPPSVDSQLSLAVGLGKRLELNARVASTSAGGGFRIQWLRQKPGIYGAIGFNVNIGFNQFPLDRLTDRVQIESHRRIDYSVPLVLGYSRKGFHFWAGPKVMLSNFETELAVCIGDDAECGQHATLRAAGRATYWAGHVGMGFGSSRFWFAVEINVARVRVSADLDVDMPSMPTMQASTAFSGRVITPAVGLMIWI